MIKREWSLQKTLLIFFSWIWWSVRWKLNFFFDNLPLNQKLMYYKLNLMQHAKLFNVKVFTKENHSKLWKSCQKNTFSDKNSNFSRGKLKLSSSSHKNAKKHVVKKEITPFFKDNFFDATTKEKEILAHNHTVEISEIFCHPDFTSNQCLTNIKSHKVLIRQFLFALNYKIDFT